MEFYLDGLTSRSKEDLKKLAHSMYGNLEGNIPPVILCSPSERALETARYLAPLLSSQPPKIEESEDLSDRIMLNDEAKLLQRLDKLLKQCGEAGIFVTHKEEAESYARLFANFQFGERATATMPRCLCGLSEAEAYHINAKGIHILPRGLTYVGFEK